jgi:hypothetical protein
LFGVTHTILTLRFTLKSGRLPATAEPPPLQLAINLGTLSLRADDLVRLIRAYHAVRWQQEGRATAQAD